MSSQLDLRSPASYELSISNKPTPNRESDWTPVAPYGTSFIESEMLFFDPTSKKATIRFNAIDNSINVYKNGILMPRGSISYSYSSSNKTITLYASKVVLSTSVVKISKMSPQREFPIGRWLDVSI